MVYDFYKEIEIFQDLLVANGLEEFKNKLQFHIETGSTASEILMPIRFILKELCDVPLVDKSVKDKAAEIISALNTLLDGS